MLRAVTWLVAWVVLPLLLAVADEPSVVYGTIDIAFVHDIYRVGLRGGTPELVVHGEALCDARPDGSRLLTSTGSEYRVHDQRTGRVATFPLGAIQGTALARWASDGRRVLFPGIVGVLNSMFVLDTGTGEIADLYDRAFDYSSADWLPGDSHIVYRIYRSVWRRSMADGSEEKLCDIQPTRRELAYYSIDVSPDGRTIALSRDDQLYVMDSNGANAVPVTEFAFAPGSPWTDRLYQARWSPDGTQLLYGLTVGNVSGVYLMHRDGSNVRRLAREVGKHVRVAYMVDPGLLPVRPEGMTVARWGDIKRWSPGL